MSYPKFQSIKISKLIVNNENPRFESVSSQRESLEIMVKEQKDKLINLSKDIIDAGVNPSELVIVTPIDKNRFKVLEGNRRVAALKFLHTPELLKDKQKIFTTKIKKLSKDFKSRQINEVQCVIFSRESDAYRWIKLKHTGENKGKGTVPWDGQQVARFDAKIGDKSSVGLQAIEFLKENTGKSISEKLQHVKITNLERLLNDKNIQEIIGITVEDGMLKTDLLKEEMLKGLTKIVQDLISKKIKVKDIYTKEDRKKYIETFDHKDIPDKKNMAETTWSLITTDKKEKKKKKRPVPPSTSRQNIIPRDCILKIKEPKINKIYIELKYLDINIFTNAGAVLLRVFIELSADAFIKSKRLPTKYNKNRDLTLKQKITNITDYMKSNGIAKKTELHGILVATSDVNSIMSVETFHSYVHSPCFSPIADNLKITWDNIQIFIEKLWDNI